MTLTKCFIVKKLNYFAHGKTLKDAVKSVDEKVYNNLSADERIKLFFNKHRLDKKYPASNYFDWHGKLTGSCVMGRESFVKNNNIGMDDMYTVKEFVELTQNSYGGETVKKLLMGVKEWKK